MSEDKERDIKHASLQSIINYLNKQYQDILMKYGRLVDEKKNYEQLYLTAKADLKFCNEQLESLTGYRYVGHMMLKQVRFTVDSEPQKTELHSKVETTTAKLNELNNKLDSMYPQEPM